MESLSHSIGKTLTFFLSLEKVLLAFLLAAMISLACVQIFLRTVFSGGLLWIDPLLRYLVVWCGLFGAVSATSQGKHIALDLFGNRMSKTVDRWFWLISYTFCCLTSIGLAWAGWLFLVEEIQSGGDGPLSIPLPFWNSIFPLAFTLIAVKYCLLLLNFLLNFKMMSGNPGICGHDNI